MSLLDALFFGPEISKRRRELRTHFDVKRRFEEIEESCIPSYVHGNRLAAWVAWQRTKVAAALYNRHAPTGPILDFGAATGEVGHLIEKRGDYVIVEQDDVLAGACALWQEARCIAVEDLPIREFAAVLALDSLEHNEDIAGLVNRLVRALRADGVFILSGPTESALYKLGRRIAGFSGHYHQSNIFHIEQIVMAHCALIEVRHVPIIGTLFRVSAWKLKA